jgi:hypothetical protein
LWFFLKSIRFDSGYYCFKDLGWTDRVDKFICGYDRAGVVWDFDLEGGVHLLIRLTCGRVFYHRHLVAELGGISNGGFDAGMGHQSNKWLSKLAQANFSYVQRLLFSFECRQARNEMVTAFNGLD